MEGRESLERYLEWLISPQNKEEKDLFSELVDQHCQIINKIPSMSDVELVEQINKQLEPYNLSLKINI